MRWHREKLNRHKTTVPFSSVQSLSRVRLCDPMNRSTPGLPVHHQFLEFTQTHVHRIGDAIQPSHPLSSPSSPAPNPSQHQDLFQWVNSSHEVAKEMLILFPVRCHLMFQTVPFSYNLFFLTGYRLWHQIVIEVRVKNKFSIPTHNLF